MDVQEREYVEALRSSLHNLHEDWLDKKAQLELLVDAQVGGGESEYLEALRSSLCDLRKDWSDKEAQFRDPAEGEHREFPKIPRLSRPVVITEKIDGTLGLVHIGADGAVRAGSKSQWITPVNDNHGFAEWVLVHHEELRELGPGYHFGEWWGWKINRGYGLKEKRWSLFNTTMWGVARPACCHVVPVIGTGLFTTELVYEALQLLRDQGSLAAPGFLRPEGVVIYHTQGNLLFKKTLERDEVPKGFAEGEPTGSSPFDTK